MKNASRSWLPVLLVVFVALGVVLSKQAAGPSNDQLVVVSQERAPVITIRSPEAKGIKYGFEGGRAVKVGSTYHLFTSEMVGDPIWVSMQFGHWKSQDGLHWKRESTILKSSAEYEGKDPRASLWSPLVVYDEARQLWNLFYVAYRSRPNTSRQFLSNHGGQIWRAVSTVSGLQGIGGPYRDLGVIMKPGPDSGSWEGLQGTDSFFPFRVGEKWFALFGSARTEVLPIEHWLVGVASAPDLNGPWKRHNDLNPAPIEKKFIENPIVTRLPDGRFICVYDSQGADRIGYAFSRDGIHWEPGKSLAIQPKPGTWSKDVRTPLGLIPEADGSFTVFYTGFEQEPNWEGLMAGKPTSTCAVGKAVVKLSARR